VAEEPVRTHVHGVPGLGGSSPANVPFLAIAKKSEDESGQDAGELMPQMNRGLRETTVST
jgi:hypothetical protein